jgi:hypothetical protein
MRALVALVLACGLALPVPAPAVAASVPDRIEELQHELDSLTEEVEDLQEPVATLERFEQCMYLIGAGEQGRRSGAAGYLYGPGRVPRAALALDLRGFGRAGYLFLAFPAEEPPSLECNEDAGAEDTDDD